VNPSLLVRLKPDTAGLMDRLYRRLDLNDDGRRNNAMQALLALITSRCLSG
jgi:hypothetical protein